jgi:glycosyltransferase involved in cell wall biosynthesis
MKIISILPAYNLENSIESIIEETMEYVDQVIVVTDGSSDKTYEMALKTEAIVPPHTYNRGKGYALRKGIEYSKKFNPEYIVFIDADGQHMPEEIPIVLKPVITEDYDMVIGSRMKGELKTSFVNKIGNFSLKCISFCVTGNWFTDTESGFRAFKSDKLYDLNLEAVSYEIESELLLKALHLGYKITEVPITVPMAVPGVTVTDGIKMGIYKIKKGIKLKIEGNK